MKRPRLSQRQKDGLLVLALFLASTAFWFAVGDFPRRIRVYNDELIFFSLGESLAAGRGLVVRGQPSSYQKILYSLLLAALHVAGSRWMRMHLLALLNAAVMSSGVVPVYLLARELIRDRRRIFAACLLYLLSADMAYTMTMMSEVLFFPLALWGIWGFYRLLVYRGSARRRRLLCAALGAYVYVMYLCKELAPAFLAAYALCAAAGLARGARGGERAAGRAKACAADLAVMIAAFLLPFIVMKLTLFRGLGGSYNQSSVGVLFGPGRVRYMLYAFVYFLCSALVGFGLFPLVFAAAFPQRLSAQAKKLLGFLTLLLLLVAAGTAYTVFVREDFDRAVPRALLRYVSWLLPAFTVVFLHQTERTETVDRRSFVRALLGAGLLVLALCCLWRGERDGAAADHLLLKYLTGTAQGSVRLVVLLWGVILLTGMALFARRPGLTLCVYVMAFGTVQLWNGAYILPMYRFENSINDQTYREVNELSELFDGYSEGNILFIPGSQYMMEVFDTYFDLPNLYTAALSDVDALQGDGEIDLRRERIPGTPEGLQSVDLVILPHMHVFDSDAPELARIGDNKVLNYNVYDVKRAAVLPHIRNLWEIHTGENVFEVTPEHFSSNYYPLEGRFTAYAGSNYLLFGPDLPLPAGDYDVVFEYRYEGDVPPGGRLGRVELNSRNVDLSAYESPFLSGETSVALRGVRVPVECGGFETKMWVDVPGVTVERIRIVKK